MPLPQSKKNAGLGRAIMNRRAKDAQKLGSSSNHTTDLTERPSWMKLQSVTQEGDLAEFLNTAQLADTDFTAERRNVTVISAPGLSQNKRHNPYLLSGEEEQEIKKKHKQNRQRLRVPRRPRWSSSNTKEQLDRSEKDAFLEWRRSLAELQEGMGFVLTPFERNLEVWRQLWRVMERSDLLVQIVDARNPLRFRCEDLEQYVLEMDEHPQNEGPANEDDDDDEEKVADMETSPAGPRVQRRNLLLINKADLLDEGQRRSWARYFDSQGISYAFFSAANAAEIQALNEAKEPAQVDAVADALRAATLAGSGPAEASDSKENSRILTVFELEDLFERSAPPVEQRVSTRTSADQGKLTVGLVGYPNVGKSSTINALMGAKKVSVSSTPGKTKHFQTLHLSDTTVLCDCPGLVFPQFATTAAELVVDGVLPIDQLREYTAPAELVAQRTPKDILEATYAIQIQSEEPLVEDRSAQRCTGLELLTAYAIARGFSRQGQGNPDESRAARYVLKDYVNARLLYVHPPEGEDGDAFNAAQRARVRAALQAKRGKPAGGDDGQGGGSNGNARSAPSGPGAAATASVDADFFAPVNGRPNTLGRRNTPGSALKGKVAADGTLLAGGQGNGEGVGGLTSSKKHFKSKHAKVKSTQNPYAV